MGWFDNVTKFLGDAQQNILKVGGDVQQSIIKTGGDVQQNILKVGGDVQQDLLKIEPIKAAADWAGEQEVITELVKPNPIIELAAKPNPVIEPLKKAAEVALKPNPVIYAATNPDKILDIPQKGPADQWNDVLTSNPKDNYQTVIKNVTKGFSDAIPVLLIGGAAILGASIILGRK